MFSSATEGNIPNNWEAQPLNNRGYYLNSPANVFAETQGHFNSSNGKFLSRTFNRRLRSKDTFTNIIPNYTHEKKTCYQLQGQSLSHKFHYPILKDDLNKPIKKMNRENTHKFDEMKIYNEEMLKLLTFAP